MAKSSKSKAAGDGRKIVAENPRARYDFHLGDTIEAGLVLTGTEVKSMRQGKATIKEAYVRVEDGECYIYGMNVSTYEQGNVFNHEPMRTRKLLLHKREIENLHVQVTRKGSTIVPLSLYFREGRAKLTIAVAKGKDTVDKRKTMSERDTKRQIDRAIKQRDY